MDKFEKKHEPIIRDLMRVFDKHKVALTDAMMLLQATTEIVLQDLIALNPSPEHIDRLADTMVRSSNIVYRNAQLPIITIKAT